MNEGSTADTARADFAAWRSAAAGNPFDGDPFFRRLLRRHLGGRYGEWEQRLRRAAEAAGPALDALVLEASRDENLPALRRHDAHGRRTEEVAFHPAYHEVGRIFWRSGVLSALAAPGSELASGAIAYLLAQNGEAGHACPVACTAGAILLLQRVGTEDQRRRWLPRLLEVDYDKALRAAQFVTEVQGGSDVGANACLATPEPGRPGWWRIRGEKWFCSVADAGLFVVSARPEGAPPGTKGLGLFLVPRTVDGRPNGFALRRLKWKLGTRSMATGEIELEGALAESIGTLDDGFRNLVGIVLDTSRVHNAVAIAGVMRRAFVEARAYARNRCAFGRRVAGFPPVQETLARMRLRTAAALCTTFRILAQGDRLAAGAGGGLAAARRVDVMVNKYWTACAGTLAVRDGIEVLGGNGTIEDFSVLPRLYRDAMVLESWEGTHNTLCAQVLRDFATRGMQHAWLGELEREIALVVRPELASGTGRARELHLEVSGRIARLLASEPEAAAAQVRHVVDRMCRLADWAALLAQAGWELQGGEGGEVLDLLELYRLTWLDPVDPQAPELPALWRRVAEAA